MRTIYTLCFVILCVFGVVAIGGWKNSSSIPPLASISESTAREHLAYLASNEMRGRNTPSPELEKAADYIAEQFKKYGLEPVQGSYFHTYNVYKTNLSMMPILRLAIGDSIIDIIVKTDFSPHDNTGSAQLTDKKLVFVGYGISAPEHGYDDYAGMDVQGKIVVMMRSAPRAEDTSSVFSWRKGGMRYMSTEAKAARAAKAGAVGMILFGEPSRGMRLRASNWPSLNPLLSTNDLPVKLKSQKDSPTAQFPIAYCGEKVARVIFGASDNLKSTQKTIDSLFKPNSYDIATCTLNEINISTSEEKFTVRNVVGMVKGSEKPEEFVVVGGHYDHVGYNNPNNPEKDSIFNGADDNASGTTGILLMAEGFAKSKEKPKRSMLFIAFSGEEKGLLGSQAFTETPPINLANCVAMLNMDMIGRIVGDSLCIGGNTRCRELTEINEQENKLLDKPYVLHYTIENYFFRSDQANFAKKKIPVLFYFTGEHADYHKVGDEISKIDFPNLVEITKLCSRTAWNVANLEGRLPYTPQANDATTPH
ncbi:MAG: M28 family peptidase [Ignavibacteria bacterium]|nr:M28 family peptidase [Ignavibacteria bacterium]